MGSAAIFKEGPHRDWEARKQPAFMGVPVKAHLPLDLWLSFIHLFPSFSPFSDN